MIGKFYAVLFYKRKSELRLAVVSIEAQDDHGAADICGSSYLEQPGHAKVCLSEVLLKFISFLYPKYVFGLYMCIKLTIQRSLRSTWVLILLINQ